MKLTALLLTIAFMGASAKGVSQSVTLSGRNIPLEKTFETIRAQTGFHVFCDRRLLKEAVPVNVRAADMPLDQFLNIIFKDQSLQYLIREQTIFVSKKLAVPDATGNSASDNKLIPIQGIIYDENGHILYGATIKVKDTERSIINRNDGRFEITVNVGDVLIISYVGFQTQELKISNSTDLIIILKRATINIEEINVKVSTGFQTISKERATGAYNVIKGEDLQDVPANNILEKLEGKVPGVRFDVRFNKIQIRTLNTYSINTAPLIVIDGFPLISPNTDQQNLTTLGSTQTANGSVLSTLNPNDIEQITFLKDAVATSIWGSRGANGVIVIETKRGKKGAPVINLSSTIGFSKAPSFEKLRWMNSAEYVDLEKEMYEKGFFTDNTTLPWYYPLQNNNPSEAIEWLFKVKRGSASQAEADAALQAIGQRNNQSQIRKYLLRTAVNQQHNLSISGGGDNNSYYISGNFNKDLPIYRGNSATNTILTGNFTNDLFNRRVKLRTGFNYQYAQGIANISAVEALGNSTISLRPYDMLIDNNGQPIRRSITMRPEVNDSLVNLGYLPFTYNAVDELKYSSTKTTTNAIRINTGVNITLTNWMNFDVSGMYQRNIMNMMSVNELESYAGRTLVNTGTVISPTTNKPVYNIPYGGTYTLTDGNAWDYNMRGMLNINYNLNADHQLIALAGSEIRQTYNKSYNSIRYGYDPEANSFATVNPTTPFMTMYGWTTILGANQSGVAEIRNRYLSYFGNAGYTYKSKYNLSGSVRFDDYTLLGLERSKRAKPFWSAGAKWNMYQEDFMQSIAWITNLGLRLTYGTGGTVPLGGNNVPIITLNAVDQNTQLPIASIQAPANQQLGWELTRTTNVGVDFGLLNNRLNGSVDAYQKRSEGILATFPFNPTYGWPSLSYNTGTMRSHGIETGITAKIVDKKDWGITSVFNFSYGKTKITESRFNTTLASTLVMGSTMVNGYPMGALFVYRSAGLNPETGQTRIYDRNDKIIESSTFLTSAFDINDIKYVGQTIAPYHGGFFNTFRLKGFELGIQMTYYFGHVFMAPTINNYPMFSGDFYGVVGRQKDLANRWRQPGDEAHTDVPGLSNVNFNSITRYRHSDKLVRSADNIRLQQISLAYNVPNNLLPKRVFKSLSVSGSMRNLGLIWTRNKDGYDPEYLNANANYYSMPPVTSYMFNINASF
ncbi:SusC/RagA family TonB-linked outer membrane protein [Chitinophaga rhizophila]|uniref:SusC/RagA family TonB-linked outer membrane protein n=1 Tax=Chitinophaga rhizophila TaxID=2866212 RepID=A0ABS7G686_9BACT|nr:SusC/RagA family TonB-linked outer membrane protein [Chitinophaga rhizophila]MBW8682971.1 SusC/RagA family TonB-linked outer membrane protein [Chitinophaga rhizophila]